MSIYEYKYNEGETLMVSCEKDKSAPGYVQYETNDIEVPECNNCYQGICEYVYSDGMDVIGVSMVISPLSIKL